MKLKLLILACISSSMLLGMDEGLQRVRDILNSPKSSQAEIVEAFLLINDNPTPEAQKLAVRALYARQNYEAAYARACAIPVDAIGQDLDYVRDLLAVYMETKHHAEALPIVAPYEAQIIASGTANAGSEAFIIGNMHRLRIHLFQTNPAFCNPQTLAPIATFAQKHTSIYPTACLSWTRSAVEALAYLICQSAQSQDFEKLKEYGTILNCVVSGHAKHPRKDEASMLEAQAVVKLIKQIKNKTDIKAALPKIYAQIFLYLSKISHKIHDITFFLTQLKPDHMCQKQLETLASELNKVHSTPCHYFETILAILSSELLDHNCLLHQVLCESAQLLMYYVQDDAQYKKFTAIFKLMIRFHACARTPLDHVELTAIKKGFHKEFEDKKRDVRTRLDIKAMTLPYRAQIALLLNDTSEFETLCTFQLHSSAYVIEKCKQKLVYARHLMGREQFKQALSIMQECDGYAGNTFTHAEYLARFAICLIKTNNLQDGKILGQALEKKFYLRPDLMNQIILFATKAIQPFTQSSETRGRLATALQEVSGTTDDPKVKAEALFMQGECAFQQHNLDEASRLFKESFDLGNYPSAVYLCSILINKPIEGDHEVVAQQAHVYFEKALEHVDELTPIQARQLYICGKILFKNDDKNKVAHYFRRAIKLNLPQDVLDQDILNAAGYLHMEAHAHQEAHALLAPYLVGPQNTPVKRQAHALKAMMLMYEGAFDKAYHHIDLSMVTLYLEELPAWFHCAIWMAQANEETDNEKVQALYDQVIATEEESIASEARVLKAFGLAHKKDFNAFTTLLQAVRDHQDNPKAVALANANLALYYLIVNDIDYEDDKAVKATPVYEYIISADTQSVSVFAWASIQQIMVNLDPEHKIERLEKAAQQSEHMDIQYWAKEELAVLRYMQDPEKTLELLQDIAQHAPDASDRLWAKALYARAYLTHHNPTTQQAIEECPAYAYLIEADNAPGVTQEWITLQHWMMILKPDEVMARQEKLAEQTIDLTLQHKARRFLIGRGHAKTTQYLNAFIDQAESNEEKMAIRAAYVHAMVRKHQSLCTRELLLQEPLHTHLLAIDASDCIEHWISIQAYMMILNPDETVERLEKVAAQSIDRAAQLQARRTLVFNQWTHSAEYTQDVIDQSHHPVESLRAKSFYAMLNLTYPQYHQEADVIRQAQRYALEVNGSYEIDPFAWAHVQPHVVGLIEPKWQKTNLKLLADLEDIHPYHAHWAGNILYYMYIKKAQKYGARLGSTG